MTTDNTQGLNEIVDYIENYGASGSDSSFTGYLDSRANAKQAILQWVADEVIGANEYYPEHKSLLRVLDKSPQGLRDKLRNQQRAILKQHGWKDGDVPPTE